ncbi:hypothetical protein [Flammeovirga agarivorans]|uniref:Uncharacterized protein n=1 Tax=Flammeovirga agarivorans TaxID=2726742 RepID=A0A7X8XVH8_9BACT|nr:hypothetical protein [Flammeovirga agarivorans]NLR91353.1 hypothetical protein [Flammeovirga agarivorans]
MRNYTNQYVTESQSSKKWSWKWELTKFTVQIIFIMFSLSLPFLFLIRGAIYLYHEYNINTWIGLMGGITMSALCIWAYFSIISLMIVNIKKIRFSHLKWSAISVALIVLSYVVFALFSFTGNNAKNEKIRAEYTQLHPYLKISVRTFLFLDKGMLITDLSRTPDDYTSMRLQKKGRSLHYKQNTGYVHAMDLRTKNRPFWMVWMAQLYFKSLGFNAVRHGGTGDHLHVSLSIYERQGSW